MKALPVLAFLVALVGLVFFPLSFEVSMSALFAAGFAAITLGDYSQRRRPLTAPVGVAVTSSRKERFGLAA